VFFVKILNITFETNNKSKNQSKPFFFIFFFFINVK
jgi:hypothetical protein